MAGFKIQAETTALVFKARFGEAPPRELEGGPTIDRVARPQAEELTEWTGRKALQIQVSFNFSIYANNIPDAQALADGGIAVERYMRILNEMRGLTRGSPEPPRLIVFGSPLGCVPHDFSHDRKRRWWLEDVAIEDEKTIKDERGRRIFIEGAVTLTEIVRDPVLVKIRQRHPSRVKKYRVKHGDTLPKIAHRFDIKGGWKELAKINHIRDPKRIRVGQELRLP